MSIFTPPKPPYKDLVQHREDRYFQPDREGSICLPSGAQAGPKEKPMPGLATVAYSPHRERDRGTRSIMPRTQRKML